MLSSHSLPSFSSPSPLSSLVGDGRTMARKAADRVHNEYFMAVVRKSCPCGSNGVRGRAKYQVYAWGEYHCAKWRTVDYFCELCFQSRVQARLIPHAAECGCSFNLVGRSGHSIPSWICMPAKATCKIKDDDVVRALLDSPWERNQVST